VAATPARTLVLRYPDGAVDAETLLVDPGGRRMFVVSKGFGGRVYEVPPEVFPGTSEGAATLLRRVGVPLVLVTDGVLAADGRLILRTYGELAVLPAVTPDVVGGSLQPLAVSRLPVQRQGEGLALLDDRTALVGSEGLDQPIWRVPVPTS
jgi:hypothetical protein